MTTMTVYRITTSNDDGWLYTRLLWVAATWIEQGREVECVTDFTPSPSTVWA